MTTTLLDGITAATVTNDRLTANVLERTGGDAGTIVFIHGNVSSASFWQPTMLCGCPPTIRTMSPPS